MSGLVPGEVLTVAGDIVLNEGAEAVTLEVANTGDRPVQVGRITISRRRTRGWPSTGRRRGVGGSTSRRARRSASSRVRRGG